ncbi:MAG: hypothetical protein GQ582_06250 [Methyloprofundus sp.]|nr:hypothetical protein [Methyloprofundus sp.]
MQGKTCESELLAKGPYNYRFELEKLESVKETYQKGTYSRGKRGDATDVLDYILLAFPNHQKVLLSAVRYQFTINNGMKKRAPLVSPVECYFQRAMNFDTEDYITVSLYAYYLNQLKLYEKSAQMYRKALTIDPDNVKILYSYSLVLVKQKKYTEALEHAQKVYQTKGVPQGLKKQLIKLGVWQ